MDTSVALRAAAALPIEARVAPRVRAEPIDRIAGSFSYQPPPKV
jgi:hypothetical protein